MTKSEIVLPANPKTAAPVPIVQDDVADKLIELAIRQDLDMDKLERLFAMRNDDEDRRARRSAMDAMAHFQATRPAINKGKQVKFKTNSGTTQYFHAELVDIVEGIKVPLSAAGLSFSWDIDDNIPDMKGLINVSCIIRHRDGYVFDPVSMSGYPDDSGKKNALQQRASTVTYLKRYTLKGALGIAEGDPDTDARSSNDSDSSDTRDSSLATEGQLKVLRAHIDRSGWSEKEACDRLGLETLEGISSDQISPALKMIKNA